MVSYSNKIILILSCILNIGLLYILFDNANKHKEQISLNMAINDSLIINKLDNGVLKAKIAVIETEKYETFLKYKDSNKEVKELQKKVAEMRKYLKKLGSVTQVKTVIKVDTIINTKIVNNAVLPTFKNTLKNRWIDMSTITNKEQQSLNLKVFFDPIITIGVEPTGFLKLGKGKTFVQFESDNPYLEVKSLKSYNVAQPRNKRFSIGPYIGYGTKGLDIGIGIQYGLIKF